MLSKLYNISQTYPFYNHTGLSQESRDVAGCIAYCRFILTKPVADNDNSVDPNASVHILLQRTQPGTVVFGVYGDCYRQPWYITCTVTGTQSSASGKYLDTGYVQFTSADLPMYTGNQLMLLNQCITVYTYGVNLSAQANGIHQTAAVYPPTAVFEKVNGFSDGYNCQVSAGQSSLTILSAAQLGKGKPSAASVWGSDSQSQSQQIQPPTGIRTINAKTAAVTFDAIGDVMQEISVLQNQQQTQMTIKLSVSEQE